MAASQPHYASASLYVGDLLPDVNEGLLFEIFSRVGPVASIRVCRDATTQKSLGYAYVNYHSVNDAERALDTLNFTVINGHPCRVMWSHRDPAIRKSGAGNVFVKDLDKSFCNKTLYDTFSFFGNIMSCKVAVDEYGKSKGYAFVHYETAEAAKIAIEKVNGMLVGGKTVFVGPFLKRDDRSDNKETKFTNLYVKGFPAEWTEQTLRTVFTPFGTITSLVLQTDAKGRRFGFVNFEDSESAKNAVQALHGKETTKEGVSETSSETQANTKEGEEKKSSEDSTETNTPSELEPKQPKEEPQTLYVQRAMTKDERTLLLKEKFSSSQEVKQKHQGTNCFIKNIDEKVTLEELKEVFSKFGVITSARIMTDNKGVSRGFGFICYAFPEEATKAVTSMHFKLFHGKPLYVGLAELKEQRLAKLQNRYRTQMRPGGNGVMVGGSVGPSQIQYGPPIYGPGPMQQGGGGRAIGGGYGGGNLGPMGGMPWRQGPRPYGGPPALNSHMTPSYPMNINPNQMNVGPGVTSNSSMRGSGGPRTQRGGGGGQQNFRFTPQARNRQEFQQPPLMLNNHRLGVNPDPMSMNSEVSLTVQSLAAAHPQMQKQLLGEKLFPLVSRHQPELAGKITGMMLEMDNAELLGLLESDEHLKAKVDEALNVLHRYQHEAGENSAGLGSLP